MYPNRPKTQLVELALVGRQPSRVEPRPALIEIGELSRELEKAKPVGRGGKTSGRSDIIKGKNEALKRAGISR